MMIAYKKLLWFCITLPAFLQAEFMLLDQGMTVISGPVANTMITHSDVFEKLNLDGTIIPLQQQIKMEIVKQEVAADKMPIDEAAIDKHFANIQKVNNLTIEDLEDLASQCHRTFAELKQLLSLQYIYDYFLYHKFRAHLVPTDQDVEEYAQMYPEIELGYCVIQVAFAQFTEDKDVVLKKINAIIAGTMSDDSIAWSDPIKVDMNDIAQDKYFIKDMNPQQIHFVEGKNVFELYRLVEKEEEHIVPLADRKAFIIDILNRKMYEDLFAKYEEHMMDNVGIINLMS